MPMPLSQVHGMLLEGQSTPTLIWDVSKTETPADYSSIINGYNLCAVVVVVAAAATTRRFLPVLP